MTNQEIAKALDTTVEKVEKAIEGMGDVNPSMLPAIGQKIHGGKMAVAAPVTAIATTEKKSTATRRTAKMKKADEALALRRDAESAVVTTQVEAAQQPQHLEALDAGASDLSLADDVIAVLSAEISADVQSIAALMVPELRALKTMTSTQKVADRHSAAMQAQGLTVAAIVAAAVPKSTVRRTLDDIFEAEMDALMELSY